MDWYFTWNPLYETTFDEAALDCARATYEWTRHFIPQVKAINAYIGYPIQYQKRVLKYGDTFLMGRSVPQSKGKAWNGPGYRDITNYHRENLKQFQALSVIASCIHVRAQINKTQSHLIYLKNQTKHSPLSLSALWAKIHVFTLAAFPRTSLNYGSGSFSVVTGFTHSLWFLTWTL